MQKTITSEEEQAFWERCFVAVLPVMEQQNYAALIADENGSYSSVDVAEDAAILADAAVEAWKDVWGLGGWKRRE